VARPNQGQPNQSNRSGNSGQSSGR
jgi:hypothetical protein